MVNKIDSAFLKRFYSFFILYVKTDIKFRWIVPKNVLYLLKYPKKSARVRSSNGRIVLQPYLWM